MNNILVIDNDFIDKLAKSDTLDLLRSEGNKIIITDKVYAELRQGVENNIPQAIKCSSHDLT